MHFSAIVGKSSAFVGKSADTPNRGVAKVLALGGVNIFTWNFSTAKKRYPDFWKVGIGQNIKSYGVQNLPEILINLPENEDHLKQR